jgi:hypothetical protein
VVQLLWLPGVAKMEAADKRAAAGNRMPQWIGGDVERDGCRRGASGGMGHGPPCYARPVQVREALFGLLLVLQLSATIAGLPATIAGWWVVLFRLCVGFQGFGGMAS